MLTPPAQASSQLRVSSKHSPSTEQWTPHWKPPHRSPAVASHLKVYTKGIDVRAIMGKNYESLDCDTSGDFAAWNIAQPKGFQPGHRLCQVHNETVIHARRAHFAAGVTRSVSCVSWRREESFGFHGRGVRKRNLSNSFRGDVGSATFSNSSRKPSVRSIQSRM